MDDIYMCRGRTETPKDTALVINPADMDYRVNTAEELDKTITNVLHTTSTSLTSISTLPQPSLTSLSTQPQLSLTIHTTLTITHNAPFHTTLTITHIYISQPSLISTLPQPSLTSTLPQPSLTSILPQPSLTAHYINHH